MYHVIRLLALLLVTCISTATATERPILTALADEGHTLADKVLIDPTIKVLDTTERVIDATRNESRKIGQEVRQRLNETQTPNLVFIVNGVKGALKDNISAFLLPLPTTPPERAAYLFTLETKVQQALQALGYYQAQIRSSLDQSSEPWQITIAVDAGEPTRYRKVSVIIDGEGQQDPVLLALQQQTPIAVGDIANHGRYEALKNQLISTGLLRGYFNGAMVSQRLAVDRANNQAELVLHYRSGKRFRFGQVNFSGSDLEPELLQSLVPFEPGSLYHNDAISQFTSDLTSVGYFNEVRVLPQPGEGSSNQVPIDVTLSKAPRHSFEVGLGYATDTEERASVTWRTPQINRFGHSQQTRLEISRINPELAHSYRIPLEHPINDQLQLGLSFGREPFGDLDSTQAQASVARQTVLTNSWTRRYFLRYLKEEWDQAGRSNQADYLLPGISFSRTHRRGPPLDPTHGFSQFYLLEFGTPLNSDGEETTRFRGQWRWVTTPWDRHRITSRVDFGINDVTDANTDQLAPSLRFFAGGDQTVRGFAYQSLAPRLDDDGSELIIGGRYMAAASIEYQYYLTDKWRIATFTDGGNAFNERDGKAIDWAYSVGVGLHWISPIGPIRADVGYGISEDDPPIRLHLTIGAEL
ncbi:autotransporter assembly complex protein TamA [Ferrimonas senticii]|uniref:autotransporter assembly complex protein TamA n=1 Tax=Ferrimonas senticii TaxID=394566 RepID=UPI000411D3C2|nr:autotransporter assembly complex family protein [Ferrimonas senticii]